MNKSLNSFFSDLKKEFLKPKTLIFIVVIVIAFVIHPLVGLIAAGVGINFLMSFFTSRGVMRTVPDKEEINPEEEKTEFTESVRLKIKELPEGNVDKYYESILNRFNYGIIDQGLGCRAEAGSTRSEKGYQMIAASTCRQLARVLGCSEAKTEVLSRAVGLYFPNYGQEGIRMVKRYIEEKGLNLNPKTLGRDMILYHIHSIGWPVIGAFDRSLSAYFNGESDPEIDIVRLVQETVKKVKIAEHFYDGNPGDLLFDVSQELVQLAKENGCLTESRILKDYEEQISGYEPVRLTEEQIQEEYQMIEQYICEFSQYPEGLEYLDRTPEEGLLTYMYMHPHE